MREKWSSKDANDSLILTSALSYRNIINRNKVTLFETLIYEKIQIEYRLFF